MTTKEIRLRLTLDNAQFLAAAGATGSSAQSMSQSIKGGAGAASASLTRATTAALGTRDAVISISTAASRVSFGSIVVGAAAFSAIASAASAAAGAIHSIPRQGISFVANTEVAELGMAGILQSMVEIEGRAPSFAQAQDMAAGSVRRLQIAAAETAASSTDLIEVYRALLGPAMAAGMSMQELERFTVVGANAVKSMGLTTGQMVQELRDLTQGGITAAGSTLATALGLKDADIARAKASSEGLFAFLMGRMQGFASSSDAYTKTLKGGWEALGEQMTQASARAMAPAAEAAKGAIAQISEALKGDQVTSALGGMGQGVATLINGMASGVGMVQQYGGAMTALAVAVGILKLGAVASDVAATAGAKLQASSASRLLAAHIALEAQANTAATLTNQQQITALLTEQRVKVAALAQEQALTASKLRSAEATAAQLVGQARLNALEQQVLPLRQQHAAQTSALEQAQQRLSAATTAASGASRAMGAVVGALGGPIGIAITAIGLLTMGLMSARAEAEKLGKTKLSVDRIEGALNSGGKVDQTDAGRVQSALGDAKEKRDGLLVESRKPASMADRSKGLFGGASVVEKRAADLAAAEADVKRLEALNARVEKAQSAVGAAPPAGVSLRGGVSSKALDEMLGDVKTVDGIKTAGAERLKALERLSSEERALMVTRGATAKQLGEFDAKVAGARSGIQRDTTTELQGLRTKQGKAARGEFGGADNAEAKAIAAEKAAADLRLAQLKQASAARTAELDSELQSVESLHQRGLTGVEAYETERLRISGEKLAERLILIDAEIAAESKRAPKDRAESLTRDRRVVELITERNTVTSDIKSGETGGAAAAAARDLERQRAIAAETAQVWQDSAQQIQQLRQSNASTAMGMITDPVERIRAETAAQVSALREAAKTLTDRIELQISLTTDPGQVEMLKGQVSGIAAETSRAIELANNGMAERLRPGWASMLDGWRDTNRLMREASDQTMTGLLKGGEDAFVGLLQTGKLNVKSLADSMVAEFARVEFRKLVGGTDAGRSGVGVLASMLGSRQAQDRDFVGPQEAGPARIARQFDGLGPVLAKFGEGLTGGTSRLGDFVSGLGSSLSGLSGLFSGGGSAAGAGAGGGWGGVISMVASLFAADGATFAAGGARKFASGGTFSDRIVDRETGFRYREGGREKLGIMGEAGPEAIMPLSGGGAQAISADGRKLGHLPVTRGPGGRLSVVMSAAAETGPRRFAAGGAFGSVGTLAAPAGAAGLSSTSLQVSAPVHVSIMDMGQVQTMINQALNAQRRALSAALKDKLGVTI